MSLSLVSRSSVSPVAAKARSMVEHGVSLLIVSQGHEPLLAVADTVIAMEEYEPRDVTAEARRLASRAVTEGYRPPRPRRLAGCRPPGRLRLRGYLLEARGPGAVAVSVHNPQLVEEAQYGTLLALLSRVGDFEGLEAAEVAARAEALLARGFRELAGREPGPALAWVRGLDFVAMLSRLPFCRFEPA